MRKLIESTFVALDGVISSPEKWTASYWSDEHLQYARRQLFAADALLLGRKTYESFVKAWPSRKGDDFSDRINALPKHVASRTLQKTTWNATRIDGDLADGVAKLKQEPGQSILKYGTGEVDRALLERNLVDEFHFWLYPVVVGDGQRLFEKFDATALKLTNSVTFATGIVVLTYVPTTS